MLRVLSDQLEHLEPMDSQAPRESRVRLASKEQPDWLDLRVQPGHLDKRVALVP